MTSIPTTLRAHEAISPATPPVPQKSVAQILENITHLAALPEVTRRVLNLVENPKTTPHDLHEVISQDPALVSRILKVANSAFYGLPGQVSSINRAIVMLGHTALVNIVVAASMTKLFRGKQLGPYLNVKELWRHSVAVGVFSEMIVSKINPTLRDEAFLGGLIHDIGILVQLQAMRDPLAEMLERTAHEQTRYVDLEARMLGIDHQALGAGLTELWNLPRNFKYVAGYHHQPLALAPECRWLTCVVHVADQVCCSAGHGFALTCHGEALNPAVLLELGITPEALEDWSRRLPEALHEAEALLG